MEKLLTLQITIFGIIALGFLLKKINIITRQGQKELTNLVIYLVLPANILNSFLTENDTSVVGDMLAVLLISVTVQVLSPLYAKLLFPREEENRKKNLVFATLCSNAGFIGNPMAEGVFGSVGLMLASVFLIPQRIAMWSEGIAIYSGSSDRKATLKKVVTHPCVLACVLGVILMLLHVQLPNYLLTPLKTVGRCNTALSMLVIGMILADIDLKTIVDKTVIVFTIHRLAVIPAIVMLVLMCLPVSPLARGLCVLLTAMPAGATTAMLAEKYNRDPGFATKLVIFSTLCSIPAIAIWSSIVML